MKRIVFTMIFTVLSGLSAFGQNENSPCPKIEIIAPNYSIHIGEIMTFSISEKVKAELKNAEIKWTVDKGKIIEGQGTSKIEIDTSGFDDTVINATLEIFNLPSDCKNIFSDSGVVATIKDYFPLDEYSNNILLTDESNRIDNLLISLTNFPDVQGYVVISISKKEFLVKVKSRVQKLIKHIKYRKFPVERITFLLDKNSNEDETEIWMFPKNSKFTICENCEIIKGSDL